MFCILQGARLQNECQPFAPSLQSVSLINVQGVWLYHNAMNSAIAPSVKSFKTLLHWVKWSQSNCTWIMSDQIEICKSKPKSQKQKPYLHKNFSSLILAQSFRNSTLTGHTQYINPSGDYMQNKLQKNSTEVYPLVVKSSSSFEFQHSLLFIWIAKLEIFV